MNWWKILEISRSVPHIKKKKSPDFILVVVFVFYVFTEGNFHKEIFSFFS